MKNNLHWELIEKSLSGNLNSDEKRMFEDLLQSDEQFKSTYETLKDSWNIEEKNPVVDIEAALQNVHQKVFRGVENPGKFTRYKEKQVISENTFSGYSLLKYAAVLVLILLIPYFIYINRDIDSGSKNIFLEVPIKKQTTVTLSDASKITLDAGTTLEYPEQFTGQSREVHINGEGLFEIAHLENRPFIVHANGARIEVLGTKFIVKAWEMFNKVTVVVTEGSVSFESENNAGFNTKIINAGKMSTLSAGMAPTDPLDADLTAHLAWQDFTIIANDTKLSEVFDQLRRWYGIEYQVNDQTILDIPITGPFRHQPVEDIVKRIADASALNFEKQGDIVVFSRKR